MMNTHMAHNNKHKPVYEDEHILAINKPRGLLTVGSKPGQKNLLDELKKTYAKQNTRLRPLNRLDRGTSGIALFAKTRECFEKAITGKLFSGPETIKTYMALLKGIPKRPTGSIVIPLPSRRDRRKLLPAKTDYKIVKEFHLTGSAQASLAEAKISSGRYHQIRVHFAKIGHPLLMDRDYMDRKEYKHWQGIVRFRYYFLHAQAITFKHFITGKTVTISTQMPELNFLTYSSLRFQTRP